MVVRNIGVRTSTRGVRPGVHPIASTFHSDTSFMHTDRTQEISCSMTEISFQLL